MAGVQLCVNHADGPVGGSSMDGDEPERGARIYRLDEYRARRSAREPIVMERDGSWHRAPPDDFAAAVARHPSAGSPGLGHLRNA